MVYEYSYRLVLYCNVFDFRLSKSRSHCDTALPAEHVLVTGLFGPLSYFVELFA